MEQHKRYSMTYSIMESNREIKNEGTKQKERRIKSEGAERAQPQSKLLGYMAWDVDGVRQ